MSIVYKFICFIMLFLQFVIQFSCYEVVLTPYEKRGTKNKRAALMLFPAAALMWMKTSGLFDMEAITVINSLITLVFLVSYICYFYADKTRVKLVHMATVLFQGFVADYLYYFIFKPSVIAMDEYNYSIIESTKACIGVTLIFFLINMIYTAVIVLVSKNKSIKIGPFGLH